MKTDGVDIVSFEEKPVFSHHVNAGIYVLDPIALNHILHGEECNMPTLFEILQKNSHRITAYPMHEPWLDVGRPSDLEKARGSS